MHRFDININISWVSWKVGINIGIRSAFLLKSRIGVTFNQSMSICIGSEVLVPSISGANTFFRFCFDACSIWRKIRKIRGAAVDRSPSAGSKCANGARHVPYYLTSLKNDAPSWFLQNCSWYAAIFSLHTKSCYYFEWIVLSVPLITTPYPLYHYGAQSIATGSLITILLQKPQRKVWPSKIQNFFKGMRRACSYVI